MLLLQDLDDFDDDFGDELSDSDGEMKPRDTEKGACIFQRQMSEMRGRETDVHI